MNTRILALVSSILLAAALAGTSSAPAAEIKVLTAGAMRGVVDALVPEFEQRTGHKVSVDNATAGALAKRIGGGEAFDVAIITPKVVGDLMQKGKIAAGTRTDLARVGMGVAVKEGAALPDIKTVDAFKRTLLAARSVAYIDPKAGGSSGIYFDGLLDRLGIGDQIRPKAKLKQGGYVADLVASGEAEVAVHQISEIVPVKGVVLVGPLPAEIQNLTTYSAGLGAAGKGCRRCEGPDRLPRRAHRGSHPQGQGHGEAVMRCRHHGATQSVPQASSTVLRCQTQRV